MNVTRPSQWTPPRPLHPGAWWCWAIGLAVVATRTYNPVVLTLVLAVAGHVVTARRTTAPWARSFAVFLRLGLVVLTFRLVAQVVFGVAQGDTLLLTLPQPDLPDWVAGVTIGGPVTLESVVAALADGLRLATILACVGAANALANPKRLLASLPAALYEVGVAVVVALSFAPAMITSVRQVRAARRLRGRPDHGIRALLSVGMPVIEDALERSVSLAAAMDSRGYGRRAAVPATTRRTTAGLTLFGLLSMCVGAYGILDAASPARLGVPVLAVGLAAAAAALRLGGRRAVRTRYRPDPWAGPEWVAAGSGLVAAAAAVVGAALDPSAMTPAWVPLTAPTLPLVPTLGLLVALLPAWLTPPPTLAPAGAPRGQITSPSPPATDGRTPDTDAPRRPAPATPREARP